MKRARAATSVIWSTVVSAAAMLGTPACHHDAAKPATPAADPVVSAEPAVPVTPAEEPPPVEPAPAVEEPAPPPAMVKVQLTSKPVGAEVYRDGELIGATPLDVSIVQSDEPVTVQVKLDGYNDKEVVFKPAADIVMQFELTKTKRARGTTGKKTGRGFVLS